MAIQNQKFVFNGGPHRSLHAKNIRSPQNAIFNFPGQDANLSL